MHGEEEAADLEEKIKLMEAGLEMEAHHPKKKLKIKIKKINKRLGIGNPVFFFFFFSYLSLAFTSRVSSSMGWLSLSLSAVGTLMTSEVVHEAGYENESQQIN